MKQINLLAGALALGMMGGVGRAEDAPGEVSILKDVAAQATGHFHEAFRYGSAGEKWGDALTRWTPSGRSFVGTGRSGEALTYKTEGLEEHQAVLVRVKLFIIYHWDGNWTVYGPDLFRVQLDQDRELLRTTFSNYGIVGQSYPDDWPWGENAARAGAAEMGTLGWQYPGGWGEPLDAVYDVWLGAVRRGGKLELEFRGDFHDARDPQNLRGEQWGIEKLEIHTFERAVELPDAVWETLAKNLLSEDAGKVAEARAVLPLGKPEQVLRALDAAATRHALDRQSLLEAGRRAAAETAEEVLADALMQAADALRRRNAKPGEPSRACRASRLYQVLSLMHGDAQWRQQLWQEMNRAGR